MDIINDCMSEKTDSGSINRRSILKGMTAGSVTLSSIGVASAGKGFSDEASSLSEEERADLYAPFDNLKKARSQIMRHTKQLRVELKEQGYLPSAKPAALQMNQHGTGPRKAVRNTKEGLNDVRVKALQTEKHGKMVAVDTWIRHRERLVIVNVTKDISSGSEKASGLVMKGGEVEAHLRESDAGVENVGTTEPYECTTEVCDDCCGTWDCSKEYYIIYDPDGSRQYYCECVPSSNYCCESGGCGSWCTC